MKFLKEYLEQENIELLKEYFFRKKVEEDNKENNEDVRNAYLRAQKIEEYNKKMEMLKGYYNTLVERINDNQAYLYGRRGR